METLSIDLGAGRFPKHPEAIQVDKPDYDLEQPIPFQTDWADIIYAEDVLEHIKNLVGLMNECHRILKTGGKMSITVPYYKHPDAFSDPTHIRYFTENSMKYFTEYTSDSVCNFDYGIKKWGNLEQHLNEEGNKLFIVLTK